MQAAAVFVEIYGALLVCAEAVPRRTVAKAKPRSRRPRWPPACIQALASCRKRL